MQWTINGLVYDEADEHIQVTANVPTKITIEERSGLDHPFHLHGQFFQVLSRDSLEVEPGLQDTSLIGGFETVHLYTEFDNIGHWMAHCHILEHAERGMMGELLVAP
jgi:FtsP/CotA-like multicopper oxidase with cupredoxin domain